MQYRFSYPLGFIALLLFMAFSHLVGDTSIIWYQTRILGLLSYLFLFLSLNIGVVKILTKGVANFRFFRLHIPASIAAVFFTLAHFISAFFDNYKWGYQLTTIQFLGFSFSNFWVSMISLGVLSFYLMVLISVTSPPKIVQKIGFKRWKLIHFLSYFAFLMAYMHSMALGTDLKTSILAPFLAHIFFTSFALSLGLLFARILNGLNLINSITESSLTVLFVILLMVLASDIIRKSEKVISIDALSKNKLEIQMQALKSLEENIASLKNETSTLNKMKMEVVYGTNN